MNNKDYHYDCKICGSLSRNVLEAKILHKFVVKYYQCSECDFVQTEKPYWLPEAYESPMNFSDTGIMYRNDKFSKITTSLLFLFFDKNQKCIDYAGGYGVFTRIMRDIGFDYYWKDPYTTNLLARGFEQKQDDVYGVVTSFECFEHLEYPMIEIEKILSLSKNVIFSTELIPKPLPDIKNWWYYATEHGQHIAFYSKNTLQLIASKFGINYYNLGNLHLFTEKKLGFFGRSFLRFKYSKQILYLLFFFFSNFMKSKTMSDMNSFK